MIAKHRALVQQLGLGTLDGVRSYIGGLIKNHRGRRDISRIQGASEEGQPLILFLKRNWKPYKKHGLASLVRRGKVWSDARQEWENGLALERAGIHVANLVGYGEECGPFWERFSFILTEAAEGSQSLDRFIETCRDPACRRKVFDALARTLRKMHDAGMASPDLFTRHVFVEEQADPPRFCLIDMARLNRRHSLCNRLRARDLAALNITAPLCLVSTRERVRFLKVYAGKVDRGLIRAIGRRMRHLTRRPKFQSFAAPRPAGMGDVSDDQDLSWSI